MLLGILRTEGGLAYEALSDLGIEIDAARRQIIELVGEPRELPGGGHIPFTPRAKKILELSLRESLDMGEDSIGSQHILLGLLREGEGLGARVLVDLGADLPGVREWLMRQGVSTRPTAYEELSFRRTKPRGELAEALNALERRLEAIEIRLAALEDRLD